MKTIKNIAIAVIVVCSLSACGFDIDLNSKKGNGIKETQEREITGDFNKVKASAGLDVYLIEGEKNKVTVETDENLQENILVYVNDDELILTVKGSVNSDSGMNVYVTYENLEYVKASSGSDISSQDVLSAENLTLKSSSGADIDLEVFAKKLILDTSSGADIKVSGKTISLEADASSGSDINAKNLQVVNCIADVSSGADITVNVKETLDVEASSGGRVNYYGDPKVTAQKDKYTSSIRKM